MDQDIASKDVIPNRHSRGRHRGNFRARGALRRGNNKNKDVNTADQSNDHPTNAFTSPGHNDMAHFHTSQRANANFRGRAIRSNGRGLDRGHANRAGRGRGNSHRGVHTNAPSMGLHQAQTPQSMPTAIATPPYNQSVAEDSWPTLSPTINLPTYPVNEHHHTGLFQLHQGNIHPVATEIPVGQFERMSLINDSNLLQYESFGTSLPLYGQLQASQDSRDLASNIHPLHQPTNVQIVNQEIAQFLSHMPLDTTTSSIGAPNISTLESMGVETRESFQSSPLSYLYSHSTLSGLIGLQPSSKTSSKTMYSIFNSPFGLMYMSILDGLSVPQKDLEEHGYRTRDLSKQELEDKQRCFGCGKFWSKVRKNQEYQEMMARKLKASKKMLEPRNEKQGHVLESKNMAQSTEAKSKENEASKFKEANPILHCRFHPGNLVRAHNQTLKDQVLKSGQVPKYGRVWSCCNKQPSAEPCSGNEHHELRKVDAETLSAQWQLYATPPVIAMNTASYRMAVALDCEMGVSKAGDSELIRVTLIDYFSTETLIDKLVFPEVPMEHLNTRYSGVTWNMLNTAAAKRQCIRGRVAALVEVWKFVGPETIVVAHSGYNDLNSLRWRHYKMVDTYLIDAIPKRDRLRELKRLEDEQKAADRNKSHKPDQLEKETIKIAEALGQDCDDKGISNEVDNPDGTKAEDKQDSPKKVKGKESFSLKALAKNRLGRDIQTGTSGHDSLEDALAARDLAHWHVRRIIEGISAGAEAGNMAG